MNIFIFVLKEDWHVVPQNVGSYTGKYNKKAPTLEFLLYWHLYSYFST